MNRQWLRRVPQAWRFRAVSLGILIGLPVGLVIWGLLSAKHPLANLLGVVCLLLWGLSGCVPVVGPTLTTAWFAWSTACVVALLIWRQFP